MKPDRLPLAAACRCGQCRFRITAPPLLTAACHCRSCQTMSGSAFSLTAIMAAEAVEMIAGAPEIGGAHGTEVQHFHCPHCKTWMLTRIAALPQIVNIRPTLLEDHGWFVPYIETQTAARLPWVVTPAEHSFAEFPPPETYMALIAAYAAL